MAESNTKKSRQQQILECLAKMLEDNPGFGVTTAGLSKAVGVSEAALYRHFPSKRKMFESLIDFIEETLFPRIKSINIEGCAIEARCEHLLLLILTFTERNPGISRILTGDAIVGESGRLRSRVTQLFDRIETHTKQMIREAEVREHKKTTIPANVAANLLLAFAEGKIMQYVRSDFRRLPTENWKAQWSVLSQQMFVPVVELDGRTIKL